MRNPIKQFYLTLIFLCYSATVVAGNPITVMPQTLGDTSAECQDIWECLKTLAHHETDVLVTSPHHLAQVIPEFSTLHLPYLFQSPELAAKVLASDARIFEIFSKIIDERTDGAISLVQIKPLAAWQITFRAKPPSFTASDFAELSYGMDTHESDTALHFGALGAVPTKLHPLESEPDIRAKTLDGVITLPNENAIRLVTSGYAHVVEDNRQCHCVIVLARQDRGPNDAIAHVQDLFMEHDKLLLRTREDLLKALSNTSGAFYAVTDKDKRGYRDLLLEQDATLFAQGHGVAELAKRLREEVAHMQSGGDS